MLNEYHIKRADGSTRKVKGYRRGDAHKAARKYAARKLGNKKLPARVDLRKQMTAVEAQGETSSCVANATAGAYEYLMKQYLGDDAYDVSRLFLYYNARDGELDEDEEMEDEGCIIEYCIDSLKEYGVCSEETWPFDEDAVNDEPSDEAYEEAEQFLVEEVEVVPLELNAWRSCLAEGHPIIFGISLFESFDKQRKPGLVPVPTKKEASREDHGGHSMLCVGYSDPDKVFIVRNSWGSEWGDQGYCYIPYRYILSEEYNDGDSWIIRRLGEIDLDESTWYDDEESVLGNYESELADMSDDDYEEMLDEMGDVALEERIALLLLHAANADDETTEDELDAIGDYLEETFEALGSDLSPRRVIRFARRNLDDEELLEESVELLGEWLSNAMLATIAADIEEVVGEDNLSDDEVDFVDWLISTWQIEDEFED